MQILFLPEVLLRAKTDLVIRPRTKIGFLDKTLDCQRLRLWQFCRKIRRDQQALW